MSKSFLDIPRLEHVYRPAFERLKDYEEVERPCLADEVRRQATRCQNCGLPFCHAMGCPLKNAIPDINRAATLGAWRDAWERLSETSPFPEFTSRVCPALCESACCLEGTGFGATNVRQIEKTVVDMAFANGWVKAGKPLRRNGRRVAIVGAGPAGLAAAAKLNEGGWQVVLYDRYASPGGLLRYGIPCFKLDKALIDRRWRMMEEAGIQFHGLTEIGKDIAGGYLLKHYDAVIVACGTPVPRDLHVPGRELAGVVQAVDLLGEMNRVHTQETRTRQLFAEDRRVLVIGGGDTGSDCGGTVLRQGAASVTSIDVMPKPPAERSPHTPWPLWPYKLRGSYAVDEGMERFWGMNTLRILGEDGHVTGAEVVPVSWEFAPNGRPARFAPSGPPRIIPCDLVVLAMGFLRQQRGEVLASLGLPDQQNVLLAGDVSSGPSLVVRAISDGLRCAETLS